MLPSRVVIRFFSLALLLYLSLLILCPSGNFPQFATAIEADDGPRSNNRCTANSENRECIVSPSDGQTLRMTEEGQEGEDPMLRTMPGDEKFLAYCRADISSFYREEPGSRNEEPPVFNGQACKFVNMSPEPLSKYWIGDHGPLFQGDVPPWGAVGTGCFPNHVFTFTKRGTPDDVRVTFTVQPGTSTYYYDPHVPDDPADPAHGVTGVSAAQNLRSLDEYDRADRSVYDALRLNLDFAVRYKNFTGGSEWLTQYPRDPPRHYQWPAQYLGQQHHVVSRQTHFNRQPPANALSSLSIREMRQMGEGEGADSVALPEYRDGDRDGVGVANLTLTVRSVSPRVFEIRNFLSDAEVDHLLGRVAAKNLERSTTSGFLSDTRTSRTTWIPRHTDQVLDAIFRRVADTLRMDEGLLRFREVDEDVELSLAQTGAPARNPINEDMQIVHYSVSQEYTAHHDFGYPETVSSNHPSRSINFCMYLNDVPRGGETHFPRWRTAERPNRGLKVKPEKGKAVIFYMVNPDGNLDDLTQHAGLPVLEGEKYFVNLWIWDPYRD